MERDEFVAGGSVEPHAQHSPILGCRSLRRKFKVVTSTRRPFMTWPLPATQSPLTPQLFLELSGFFNDPADVGYLISGSSAFLKTSFPGTTTSEPLLPS